MTHSVSVAVPRPERNGAITCDELDSPAEGDDKAPQFHLKIQHDISDCKAKPDFRDLRVFMWNCEGPASLRRFLEAEDLKRFDVVILTEAWRASVELQGMYYTRLVRQLASQRGLAGRARR